jgi:hypothetical protein
MEMVTQPLTIIIDVDYDDWIRKKMMKKSNRTVMPAVAVTKPIQQSMPLKVNQTHAGVQPQSGVDNKGHQARHGQKLNNIKQQGNATQDNSSRIRHSQKENEVKQQGNTTQDNSMKIRHGQKLNNMKQQGNATQDNSMKKHNANHDKPRQKGNHKHDKQVDKNQKAGKDKGQKGSHKQNLLKQAQNKKVNEKLKKKSMRHEGIYLEGSDEEINEEKYPYIKETGVPKNISLLHKIPLETRFRYEYMTEQAKAIELEKFRNDTFQQEYLNDLPKIKGDGYFL